MNTKDFIRLGIPLGEATRRATDFVSKFILGGGDKTKLQAEVSAIVANPSAFTDDPLRSEFAKALLKAPPPPRSEPVKYRQWGEGLEHDAVMQMEKACLLPVAVAFHGFGVGEAIAMLVFLVIVFAYALTEHIPIMNRWIDRPYLFVFPAIGAVAAAVLVVNILRRNDHWPFTMVALIFASAFGTLALSFWPYMIPFVITIDEAAAPHSSVAFMFWGAGILVFPLMLLYTAISYSVFRGKVRSTAGHY